MIIIYNNNKKRKLWLLLKMWIEICAGSEAMFADLGHFSYTAIQVPSNIYISIYLFFYLSENNFL